MYVIPIYNSISKLYKYDMGGRFQKKATQICWYEYEF